MLSILSHLLEVTHVVLNELLLRFGQELWPLCPEVELLHLVLLQALLLGQVFGLLGEDLVIVVSVLRCCHILRDLVAKLEVGYFEVHLGHVRGGFGSLTFSELVGDVRRGFLSVSLLYLGLLSDIEI